MSYFKKSTTVLHLQDDPGPDQGHILLSDDCIYQGQKSSLETKDLCVQIKLKGYYKTAENKCLLYM